MRVKRATQVVIAVSACFALGWKAGVNSERDPSRDWDPQAGQNPLCLRQITTTVAGPGIWSARSYEVNCDVVGNSVVTYVYLLQRGQTASPAGLIFRYEGDLPTLRWENADVLSVRARAASVSKQSIRQFGIAINYE